MKVIDIIKEVVNSTDFSIQIDSIEDLGDGNYKIYTCDPSYVNDCITITQNGNEYSLVEIGNEYIVINGLIAPELGTLELDGFSFVHGTYIDANNARIMMSENSIDKPVMVFFVSTPLDMKVYSDVKDIRYSTIRVRLLLLADNNRDNWCPDDHFDKCINQMENMSYRILKNTRDRFDVDDVKESDNKLVMNVGITKDKKGQEKSLFDWTYSGVVMDFELSVYKNFKCTCCKL